MLRIIKRYTTTCGKSNNHPLSSGSFFGCIPNKNGYEEWIITEIQAFIKSFITHFLGGSKHEFPMSMLVYLRSDLDMEVSEHILPSNPNIFSCFFFIHVPIKIAVLMNIPNMFPILLFPIFLVKLNMQTTKHRDEFSNLGHVAGV